MSTVQTVDQPTVIMPAGHAMTLPLREGGYTARVAGREGANYLVAIGALPFQGELLLYACDVRA